MRTPAIRYAGRGSVTTPDHAANAAAGVAGGATIFGMAIGEFNQYLQAAAFIVAIVSGLCASYYYVRKAHRK
jgi:hypothetical protein